MSRGHRRSIKHPNGRDLMFTTWLRSRQESMSLDSVTLFANKKYTHSCSWNTLCVGIPRSHFAWQFVSSNTSTTQVERMVTAQLPFRLPTGVKKFLQDQVCPQQKKNKLSALIALSWVISSRVAPPHWLVVTKTTNSCMQDASLPASSFYSDSLPSGRSCV